MPEVVEISWLIQLFIWSWFIVTGFRLALWDIRHHRLPNRLVSISLLGAVFGFVVLAAVSDAWAQLGRAATGVGLSVTMYFILHLVGGMGMGDVKYSAVTGMYLAWLGWEFLWWGTFISFAGAACLVFIRRIRRSERDAIPFGPFMALGVIVAGPAGIL